MVPVSGLSPRGLRELVDEALLPLAAEQVSERYSNWREALDGAAELAQHMRCGHDALVRVAARLSKTRDAMGRRTGDRGDPWVRALDDCGRAFVENCASLVEVCQSAPAWLAPRILGCTVRLAEALGSTGPLLEALDAEFTALEDRVEKLQKLYVVALRRAEAVAGQVPGLEDRVLQATHGRDELRAQCRDVRQALQRSEKGRLAAESKAEQLARELRSARQQQQQQGPPPAPPPAPPPTSALRTKTWQGGRRPAEHTIAVPGAEDVFERVASAGFGSTETRGELHPDLDLMSRLHRASTGSTRWSLPGPSTSRPMSAWQATQMQGTLTTSLQRPPPWCSQLEMDSEGALAATGAADMSSVASRVLSPVDESSWMVPRSTNRPMLPSGAVQRIDRTWGDEAPPVRSEAHRVAGAEPTTDVNGTPGPPVETMPRCSSDRSLLDIGGGGIVSGTLGHGGCCVGAGSPSPAFTGEIPTGDALSLGTLSVRRLSAADPLAASTKAAFDHLAVVVRQARERHARLGPPQGEWAAVDAGREPVEGLRQTAAAIERWAAQDSPLASLDSSLAGTVRTSASHLRMLAGLMSATHAPVGSHRFGSPTAVF